jgi:hypothetical protein
MFTGCEKDISDQRRAMPAAGVLFLGLAILLARNIIAQSYDQTNLSNSPIRGGTYFCVMRHSVSSSTRR